MNPAEAAGRLLLVGAGAMGGAMLGRWLATGLSPAQVTVVSPSGRAMPAGVTVVGAIPPERFDTVLLALKPQQLPLVRDALRDLSPRLLVSILAGVDLAALRRLSRAAEVARAMPNLPVAFGKGVIALAATGGRALLETLMRPLGLVEWIEDEALFDVVTALAGSGPAFLYRYLDAMAAAGAALGLPCEQAARLALATVEGAALLAATTDTAPAALADRVASRGGSTRVGLDVLDRDDALVTLLTATLRAAAARNAALAREAG